MHIIIHLRQYIKNTGNLWNEYKLWRNEESPEHKVENLKIKKAQILFACFHPFLVMGWIPKIVMICYLQCENEAKYAMSPNTENIRTSLVYLEYLRKKSCIKSHFQFIPNISKKIRDEYTLCNQKFISNIEGHLSNIN